MVYIKKAGKWAVDEMCHCGHAKSEHGSSLHRLGDELIRSSCTGNCCATGCDCTCDRFCWVAWIYEKSPMTTSDQAQVQVPGRPSTSR